MAHPDQIGPYKIEKKLGAGAMGQVYLAVDNEMFGRKVALKILSEQLSENDYARRRFQQEVETAAKLAHSNIVTIYAQGEHDSRPYFTMEYLDGLDLDQYAKGRDATDLIWRIDIGGQIASALACAHSSDKQVVHRDVKPANIMVVNQSGKDIVKLLDFGIVHIEHSRMTTEHTQPGTFAYMSPEQLRGDPIDPRSDLFSLGIVLFELFTGSHPFEARNDLLISNRILDGDPNPAQVEWGRLPRTLDSLLNKLLQKDPNRRPSSAAEVADALDEELRRQHQQRPSTDPGKNTSAEMQQVLDDLLSEAKKQEAESKYEEALEALERARVVAPADRRIEQRIARVTHRMEAARRLQEHVDKAKAALAVGKVTQARDRWREAWIISPDNDEIAQLEKQIESAEHAMPVLREQQDFVASQISKAKKALEGNDVDAARALLVEALRRDTDNGQIRQLLDRVIQIEESGADYGSYRALLREAMTHADHGEYAAALRCCARAREIWADEEAAKVERDVRARRAARLDTLESKANSLLDVARDPALPAPRRTEALAEIEAVLKNLDELESRETAATLRGQLAQLEQPPYQAPDEGRSDFEEAARQIRAELDRVSERVRQNPQDVAKFSSDIEALTSSVAALADFDAEDERTRSIQADLVSLREQIAGPTLSLSEIERATADAERVCAKGPAHSKQALQACEAVLSALAASPDARTDVGRALQEKLDELQHHAKTLIGKQKGHEVLKQAKARLREASSLLEGGDKRQAKKAREILEAVVAEVKTNESLAPLRKAVHRLVSQTDERLGRTGGARRTGVWLAVAIVLTGLVAGALAYRPLRNAIFGSDAGSGITSVDSVSRSSTTSPVEEPGPLGPVEAEPDVQPGVEGSEDASARPAQPQRTPDSPVQDERVEGSEDAREREAPPQPTPDSPVQDESMEGSEDASVREAPPQPTTDSPVQDERMEGSEDASVREVPPQPTPDSPSQDERGEVPSDPERGQEPDPAPDSTEASPATSDAVGEDGPPIDPNPPLELDVQPGQPADPSDILIVPDVSRPPTPTTIPAELEQSARALLDRSVTNLTDQEYGEFVQELDVVIVAVDATPGSNRASILEGLKAKQGNAIERWKTAALQGRASPSAVIAGIDRLERGALFEDQRTEIEDAKSENEKQIRRTLGEWKKIWESSAQPERKTRELREMISDGRLDYEVPEIEIRYNARCTIDLANSLVMTIVPCDIDMSANGRPISCQAVFEFKGNRGTWTIDRVTEFQCD